MRCVAQPRVDVGFVTGGSGVRPPPPGRRADTAHAGPPETRRPPEPDIPPLVSGPAVADAGQGRLCATYRRVPAISHLLRPGGGNSRPGLRHDHACPAPRRRSHGRSPLVVRAVACHRRTAPPRSALAGRLVSARSRVLPSGTACTGPWSSRSPASRRRPFPGF